MSVSQEGEGHLDTLLRSLVLSQLGQAGDTEVRAEAKRRFDAHVNGVSQISPDIRSVSRHCPAVHPSLQSRCVQDRGQHRSGGGFQHHGAAPQRGRPPGGEMQDTEVTFWQFMFHQDILS